MTIAERAARWLENGRARRMRWFAGDDYAIPMGPVFQSWQGFTFLSVPKETADLIYGEKLPPIDWTDDPHRYKTQALQALAQKGIRNDQHTRPKSAKHGRR